MKKLVSIILSSMMVLSLGACGDPKGNASTYDGTGEGMHGDVKVQVALEDGKIKDVKVVEQSEIEEIAGPAIERMPQRIVDAQSINVDTVTGATVTSTAILEATKDALTKAGVNLEDFEKEVATTEESDKETKELTTDVVVIGGGGAGLAAATAAEELGADVIVLEKMPATGGSTIISGGQYNAYDKKRQEAQEMRQDNLESLTKVLDVEPANDLHEELINTVQGQLDEYKANGNTYIFDSPELHALQAFEGGDRVGNLELIYQLTQGAEESLPWLESLGVEIEDHVGMVTGALWPRTHQFVTPLMTGPLKAYVDRINDSDHAEIMLETCADELIVEDNKVIGVLASSEDTNYVINANNGVVIATGGFARNHDLIKKYDTHWGGLDDLGSTNAMGATGDGIIMAEKVNANLVGMDWIQLLPVGNPETGGMSGNISINAADQLFVNLNGERFVPEDARRDTLTQALLEQPEHKMFILQDAHDYTDGNVKNDFNETIDELVEQGQVVKGDTIEELAENMGVDADNLKAAVETYNKAVDGEIEDPIGKQVMENKFDKAPFYAGIRVPTIHHTMGGLEIDSDAHVINQDGEIIDGLYAAGEVTGGIHGSNRLGGNALPDTVVFGKIAGTNAANKN